MAINHTPNLNLALLVPNDPSTLDNWGTNTNPEESVNEEFVLRFEEALTKIETIDIQAEGPTKTFADSEEARFAVLELEGTLTSNKTVNLPAISRQYIIASKWQGDFSVTVRSNGNQLQVFNPETELYENAPLLKDEIIIVYTDGTTIRQMSRVPVVVPEGVPEGVIMMWSGSPSSVPTGWQLCDGKVITGTGPFAGNSTPDLTDKFIVGGHNLSGVVPQTDITGSTTITGGVALIDTNEEPAFSGATDAVAISIGQMPKHKHLTKRLVPAVQTAFNSSIRANKQSSNSDLTSFTGGDAPHDHSVNIDAHTHEGVTNVSPYWALAFIMKI